MRPLFVVALASAIVFGGCLGSPATDTTSTEITGTPRASTASPETAAGTPNETTGTSAVPPDASSENTVAFEDLTEEEQAAFLDARDSEVSFGPSSCPDVYARPYAYTFRNHEYVRYEGQYYSIAINQSHGRLWQSRTYQLRPGTPQAGSTVITFENLSASVKEKVRAAIANEYRSPYCGDPPAVFYDADYIRDGNTTYEVKHVRVSDVGEWRMTVSKYEA